jgi:succinate dehydrogenase / fumarate reductase membrane anchor subunit
MIKDTLISPLAKAKGLGAAGNGTSTWWAQRVSAVALVPLVIWFAVFVLQAAKYNDMDSLVSIFTSPFPTIFLTIFLAVGIYHGNIGMKEIIEDYVHCHAIKISLIILVKFISFISAIAGVCALIVLHLSTMNFN